jgi:F0F1-type ATP synthase epsilon subunit
MFNMKPSPAPAAGITLTVKNRVKILFQEPVKAVTSVNAKGKFDILAEHANFISIIKDYIIIHKFDGTDQQLKITRGVLKVDQNKVSIYIGLVPESKAPAHPLSS